MAEKEAARAAVSEFLTIYTPSPGTPEADAIRLLASWNADSQPTF